MKMCETRIFFAVSLTLLLLDFRKL